MGTFERRTIKVNGISVEIDTEAFEINDVDEAQRTSASLMAFWASVCGSAEAEVDAADAHYRNWRAKAADVLLKADPKAAEWKVKAAIESHTDFLVLKTALATAADNLATAQRMFDAASKRANLAQSIGAKLRDIGDKVGSATRTRPTTDSGSEKVGTKGRADRDDDDDDGEPAYKATKPKLKEILGKKKRKGDTEDDD